MIFKEARKRIGLVLLALLFVFSLSAACGEDRLWVSSDGDRGIDAIDWYEKNGRYYLFLPGNVTLDQLRIGFSGAKTIEIDGQTIGYGDSAACLPLGQRVSLAIGRREYKLTAMQGSSGLPALYIHTKSGALKFIHRNKKNREPGTLLFVSPQGQRMYDGALSHIKMRGNSSINFKKKNYQIKLEDAADFMGMGESRTWILTGNSRDKSLLRNQITFDMAMYAKMAYTPEHLSAEVYINHEYMGLYLFSEKVMIEPGRIDIADLEEETEDVNEKKPEEYERTGPSEPKAGRYKAYAVKENPQDITGGYLIEFERYASSYGEEASVYYSLRNNTMVIKSPEYCSKEQMAYISGLMQACENAIFSKDGVDRDSGKHYSELLDMDSLVNKYLIEEVSKNYDGNYSSMFFYKPSDEASEKVFAGPVWDYDSSYGSYAQKRNKHVLEPEGFWINNETGKRYWWPALYKQKDFKARVIQQYQSVFRPALEILLGLRRDETGTLRSLDEYAAQIWDSAQMNSVRWPALKTPTTVANTGHTFDMNIAYLRRFIEGRYQFLNSEWE